MIVADTGAIIALVDADDDHHERLTAIFEREPTGWILPWAILPEVDYLLASHVGRKARDAFLADLADDAYAIEWSTHEDLERAHALHIKYKALKLGLVDGIVIAIAERLRADAIATIDLKHFGAVAIRGKPKLLPRDEG